MSNKPVVVVAVIITKPDGTCLMGRRKGGELDGRWCFPGGKLEYRESLVNACVREVYEETGISLKRTPDFWTFTESYDLCDGGHMLGMVFRVGVRQDTEAKLTEPDKFYEWQWFRWEDIPRQSMTIINRLVSNNPLPDLEG